MITWEEIDEGYLRARAGWNADGVRHSYDARFYATVTEQMSGATLYFVEFYDTYLDRETGLPHFLFEKSGTENDIFDAQTMVEAIIYQAMANEAMAELEASRAALEGSESYNEY